jgi:hypothetical protein
MEATAIRIRGSLIGTIWMPAAKMFKNVDETFSLCRQRREDHSAHGFKDVDDLRDALLKITNDGDFQECAISRGALLTVIFKDRGREIRKSRYLAGQGENADLFTDDEPEYFDED